MDETEKRLSEILIAEYFGTILIALFTGFSFNEQTEFISLKLLKDLIGIFLAIFLMRKISCAYFNPGVFIMFLQLKNSAFYKKHILSYIMAQCLGATSGFLLYTFLTLGRISVPCDINQISFQTCFVGEFISSFVFYLLIIIMADPDYAISEDYVHSIVSVMCGIGCGYALGFNLSGSSMNPSNGIASLFVAFLNTANVRYLFIGFVYFTAPILAGISVAKFYVDFIKNGENPFLEKKVEVRNKRKIMENF